MRYAAKIDVNQPEIVRALRRVGAHVIDTHMLKMTFDIIVIYRGKSYHTEIKNIDAFPMKKDNFLRLTTHDKRVYLEKQLTDGEKEQMIRMNNHGVEYYIVYDVRSSLRMIEAIN